MAQEKVGIWFSIRKAPLISYEPYGPLFCIGYTTGMAPHNSGDINIEPRSAGIFHAQRFYIVKNNSGIRCRGNLHPLFEASGQPDIVRFQESYVFTFGFSNSKLQSCRQAMTFFHPDVVAQ